MRLRPLIKDRWKICAPLDVQNKTEIEIFLSELDGNYRANRNGLLVIMERYAKQGPAGMNDAFCHLANKKEKIWEFIKGRLRVYWFDTDDGIVVCVCGCIKKTQKVDPSMVNRAVQMKDEYFRLKKAGIAIEIVEEEGR